MNNKETDHVERLTNDLTPYVIQPESGTAEFVITRIVEYLIWNFTEDSEVVEEDEFFGKLYGSHGKIEVERLESLITQLQCSEMYKKAQFEEEEID